VRLLEISTDAPDGVENYSVALLCFDEYQHAVLRYDNLFLFCGNGRVLVLAQGFLDLLLDLQQGGIYLVFICVGFTCTGKSSLGKSHYGKTKDPRKARILGQYLAGRVPRRCTADESKPGRFSRRQGRCAGMV
jgi:hypothetical protein